MLIAWNSRSIVLCYLQPLPSDLPELANSRLAVRRARDGPERDVVGRRDGGSVGRPWRHGQQLKDNGCRYTMNILLINSRSVGV